MPAVVTVLASAANYMICDDHEFVDDLGEGGWAGTILSILVLSHPGDKITYRVITHSYDRTSIY